MTQRWPERLWIVRHGQSAGNVARDAALAAELHRIAIDGRDVDVPLSPLGERQAHALGLWFGEQPEGDRPDALLVSPYVRAVRTAELFRDAGGMAGERLFCRDERLREKEFGMLDGLTTSGIATAYPEQAEFRRLLGKFYHRPPGGESWCDVILRLRSVLDTVSLHYGGRRVMIVCHQVVVLCLRYIIERMDEAAILAIDRQANVANCGVTEYRFDPGEGTMGGLRLARYNDVVPVEQEGEVSTAAPDPIVAARG
ncbi:histidine phosphatase family protein [uncultured Sphingomonas sp.]|uniref:histidine phosphatase family protein n=1 Tax=uncultured Sphingomonas sp. TaxID=158754 RepID=UPI0025D9FBBC|nr:histidine phosphatase family protein [uncultured Sphingomonas sp.]